MKSSAFLPLLALATIATAQDDGPPALLQPGDTVTPAALAASDWIQGSAPEKWEQDKLYVLDCWATWCGPCIAAIPHLNELHKKFGNKGLRISGMNVWEEGRDMIAAFVKQQGDKMSYPVAYSGPDGAFDKAWMKAAAVRAIPHTLVVKNGTLLFTTVPDSLTEEMINALLEGGEAEAAVVAKIRRVTDDRKKASGLLGSFREAMAQDDHEAMSTAITELGKLDPDATFLPQMRLDLAIATEDWDGAGTIIDEIAKGERVSQVLGGLAFRCDRQPDQLPQELKSKIAIHLAAAVAGENANPTLLVILSRLQWSVDDKENALATAKTVAKKPGNMPAAPFERYLKSIEEGEPAKAAEVFGWLRQEMLSR